MTVRTRTEDEGATEYAKANLHLMDEASTHMQPWGGAGYSIVTRPTAGHYTHRGANVAKNRREEYKLFVPG